MIIDEEEYLAHYGVLRRSGRYPWGSGKTQSIRNRTFLDMVEDLHRQGLSETQIVEGLGLQSTTQLRALKSIAKNEQKMAQIGQAERLKAKGYSNGAIAEKMGLPGESSVRALLAPGAKERAETLVATANMLKEQVAEKTYLGIGSGNELYVGNVGISKEKLNTAVAILREEGYMVHTIKVPQLGTRFETEHKVLCPPGTTWADVKRNQSNIQQLATHSEDGGHTFVKTHPPISIDPKRVHVVYGDEGGLKADGVIYVRPGVEDVSIGQNRYAQVRIKVGEDRYLKGMAIYKDDLPDGVDLVFNTNKKNTGNKLDAMKKISDDPDLPFSSVVRQIVADGGTPHERVTSAMNIVGTKPGSGAEGSWNEWSSNLSSQFLSKQSPSLARTQLDMTYERRRQEFDEIMGLTNPTVRKKLLEKYAESTDAAAVHLKAAAMPRQNWRVILPVDDLPPTQVYAPGYDNGERVVLVRYPHGGTFEIPELTVNNRHPSAKKLLGDSEDAIGIHHQVAERLSGADFDGDTVLIIPNNSGRVKVSPSLERLKSFEPKVEYAPYDGMKTIDGGVYRADKGEVDYGDRRPSSRGKGIEMGKVSNLITDMTLQGASHDQIARAVRHSMVVIDAEKHHLNWKQSALDNNIKQLKEEYQGGANKGASTLISRKKQEESVFERKPRPRPEGGPIDEQGRRVYVETGRTKINAKGERVRVMQDVRKLDNRDDAHSMESEAKTPMERLYADHSNRLKALANQARLASESTPRLIYSKSAKETYRDQVASLTAKLAIAERNAPLEKQAQILGNAEVKAKRDANPDLDADSLRKIKYQALENARARLGAGKRRIEITDEEWDAIQAGAISNARLIKILNNTDVDRVRELATPRAQRTMTTAKTRRAQAMLDNGYTRAEVASQLGVSVATLDAAIKG